MSHEVRERIIRPATPEERERHARIRAQVEAELPEIMQWAKAVAERHKDQVVVGTVFSADEAEVIKAIDEYAAKHALQDRGAVVRAALANLLGIDLARQ